MKAIEMQMPVVQDVDVKVVVDTKKAVPSLVKQNQQSVSNSGDIINLLNNIFSPNYSGDKNKDILTLTKVSVSYILLMY